MRQAVWRGGAVLGLLLTTGSPVRADDSSGLDVVDHLPVANVVVRTGLGLLGANESSRTYTAFRQTDDVTSVGPQTDRDSALFAGD